MKEETVNPTKSRCVEPGDLVTPANVDPLKETVQHLIDTIVLGGIWGSGGRVRDLGDAVIAVQFALAQEPPDSLDAAWAAAMAALPDGWCDLMVYHFDTSPKGHNEPAQYGAKSTDPDSGTDVYGYGPTPAAALRALAARLEEIKP